jgi:hypothetical protein
MDEDMQTIIEKVRKMRVLLIMTLESLEHLKKSINPNDQYNLQALSYQIGQIQDSISNFLEVE